MTFLAAAALVAIVAAGATASARGAGTQNHGLPHEWYGIAKWSVGGADADEVITYVTWTLTKKTPYKRSMIYVKSRAYYLGQAGIVYTYTPSGTFTETQKYGCQAPRKGHLKVNDGGLGIEVETATGKAAYWGGDNTTLQAMGDLPTRCPNGAVDSGAAFWFQTTPIDNGKPIIRPMSTSATIIEGKWLDTLTNPVVDYSYEWCFVRSHKDLLKCSYVATG
jgi:hypothetical protein